MIMNESPGGLNGAGEVPAIGTSPPDLSDAQVVLEFFREAAGAQPPSSAPLSSVAGLTQTGQYFTGIGDMDPDALVREMREMFLSIEATNGTIDNAPVSRPHDHSIFNFENIGMDQIGFISPDVADALQIPSTGAGPIADFQLKPAAPVAPPSANPASGGLDVAAIRRDFPALHQQINGKPLIWLDNAATTHKPQCVIDAVSNFFSRDNSNIHRAAHTLAARATDAYEQARQKVQLFLGAASPNEIVFTRGTTEAINLVAQTYGRQNIVAGDEIVLTTLEHHANIVPWQMLAQERGAKLRVVPITDAGDVCLAEVARVLSPRTKMVAVSHVSNVLGTVLPVAQITAMAHAVGAVVLVDGAQAVAHVPVNVRLLDVDFYVFSGHKIFAPTAVGVLYGKEHLLREMPPWQGGGNMIDTVTFEKTTYNAPPAKFEAGTSCLAEAVGLGAALDYLARIGIESVSVYEHYLADYGMKLLASIPGIRLIGTVPGKVGVFSFVMDGLATQEVGRLLDLEGIAVRSGHHCAQPTMARYNVANTVRPSVAFYNTTDELDKLADVLRRIKPHTS